jgi:hypothetical protein
MTYTPSTDEVREKYGANNSKSWAKTDAEFDRWLTGELAKAWDEGHEKGHADGRLNRWDWDCAPNPYDGLEAWHKDEKD